MNDFTLEIVMLASGADKAGNPSAGRYINYQKFFSSVYFGSTY